MRSALLVSLLVSAAVPGLGFDPACPCVQLGGATNTSARCAPWDRGRGPHCPVGQAGAAFCDASWCYVDAERCRGSTHVFAASTVDADAFYSYSTCNESGRAWWDYQAIQAVEGRVLRVAIPSMDYPMHFKRDPATGEVATGVGPLYRDDSVPFEGSMIQYLDAVLQHSNLAGFNYTWASVGSRHAHPDSKWTAAVYDVALGLTDMGGSDFWLTTQRARMSAFSAPFDVDHIYLWVPRPVVDDSFGAQIGKMFRPFHWTLWLTIGGVIVGMSLFELWLFREDWRDDGFDEWAEAKDNAERARFLSMELLIRLGYTTMTALAGFQEMPYRPAQFIAWIGWAAFCLMFLSAYTANLAAWLSQENVGFHHRSMRSAVDARVRICVAAAMEQEVRYRHPQANLAAFPFSGDFATEYAANGCEAVLWSMPVVQRVPQTAAAMCALNLVAVEAVISMNTALPAAGDVAPALSYFVKHHYAATGHTFYGTFEAEYHQDGCDGRRWTDASGSQASVDGLVQLTPANFAAPLMLMAICCGLSFVKSVWDERRTAAELSATAVSAVAGAVRKQSAVIKVVKPGSAARAELDARKPREEPEVLDGTVPHSPAEAIGTDCDQQRDSPERNTNRAGKRNNQRMNEAMMLRQLLADVEDIKLSLRTDRTRI
jgi:hypothetical protein